MQNLQPAIAAFIAPPKKRLAMTAAAMAMPAPLGVIAAAVARHTDQGTSDGQRTGGDQPTGEAPVDPSKIRPELVEVPELVGRKLDKAIERLDHPNVQLSRRVVWHYSSDPEKKDIVVKQDPCGGDMVERPSTTVILSVANGEEPESREEAKQRKFAASLAKALVDELERRSGDAMAQAYAAGAEATKKTKTSQTAAE